MCKEDNNLLIINEEEVGKRIDQVLTSRFEKAYSRTYFQQLIEKNLILVNSQPIKKKDKLKLGDEIEVQFALIEEISLLAEAIPLAVLYEDEFLIIINKPAGMVVHPAPGNWSGTFVNALLYHCNQLPLNGSSLRPGIVHRLDKETSGVLIAAKTLEMQQKLSELFASRQIYKEYLAICLGNVKEGKIETPIGRHPVHRKQMAVVANGKKAISIFQNLRTNEKLSLVRIVIETGRTHQIRVHLKYQGTPVLGDSLYGHLPSNRFYKVERQLLHASVLRFVHPLNKQELTIQAPLPIEMEKIISCCKL